MILQGFPACYHTGQLCRPGTCEDSPLCLREQRLKVAFADLMDTADIPDDSEPNVMGPLPARVRHWGSAQEVESYEVE